MIYGFLTCFPRQGRCAGAPSCIWRAPAMRSSSPTRKTCKPSPLSFGTLSAGARPELVLIPIGSNIDAHAPASMDREQARASLGVAADELLIVLFWLFEREQRRGNAGARAGARRARRMQSAAADARGRGRHERSDQRELCRAREGADLRAGAGSAGYLGGLPSAFRGDGVLVCERYRRAAVCRWRVAAARHPDGGAGARDAGRHDHAAPAHPAVSRRREHRARAGGRCGRRWQTRSWR